MLILSDGGHPTVWCMFSMSKEELVNVSGELRQLAVSSIAESLQPVGIHGLHQALIGVSIDRVTWESSQWKVDSVVRLG